MADDIRDEFAAQALSSLAPALKQRPDSQVGWTADEIAERAYTLADAMMKRRAS